MWRKCIVALLIMVVSLSIVSCANPNSDNDNSGDTFQVKYYEYFGNEEQNHTYTEETISQNPHPTLKFLLIQSNEEVVFDEISQQNL